MPSLFEPQAVFDDLSLEDALQKIAQHPDVCGILTMGSTSELERFKSYSDYDIFIITDDTPLMWTALTSIDGHLADLVFVEKTSLQALLDTQTISISTNEASFAHWFYKGTIAYDRDDLLQALQQKFQHDDELPLHAMTNFQYGVWFGIHYNYFHNHRMWQSEDNLYVMALQMRLLYCISDLMTAYFIIRGMHWQGEKWAIRYWQQHDPTFHEALQAAINTTAIDHKMLLYAQLADHVLESLGGLHQEPFTMMQAPDSDMISQEWIEQSYQFLVGLLG